MKKIINKVAGFIFNLLGLPYMVIKKTLEILYKIIVKLIEVMTTGIKMVVNALFAVFNIIWDILKKVTDTVIKFVAKIINLVIKIINSLINLVKKCFNVLSNIFKFIYKWLKKGLGYIPLMVKLIAKWFIKAIKESIAQIFTLLGFFIAWLTLTGSAKDIVGIAILISTALWLLTIGLREE